MKRENPEQAAAQIAARLLYPKKGTPCPGTHAVATCRRLMDSPFLFRRRDLLFWGGLFLPFRRWLPEGPDSSGFSPRHTGSMWLSRSKSARLPRSPSSHKGHGGAETPHAPGAAGAVGVDLGSAREVVIDNVTHVGEIESAAGHIGGHHHPDLLAAKTVEYGDSAVLVETSVDVLHGLEPLL